ncbi:MAG: hypothetical protein JWR42_2381 [Marmoricola sp.]|nr:hypothetical protein [Marmoricola sp.]
MSTAHSWTDGRASRRRALPGSEAVADLRSLLAFRSSGLDARALRRLRAAGLGVAVVTALVVLLPAFLGGPQPRTHGGAALALLPSGCLGFLALACLTAVASAGGRELVPRDQAVAFPVSATTDHLGALLLAPLNIAWLLQAWTLLGVTAYALGPTRLVASVVPVALWILAATCAAQAVGWLAEGVRRGPYGVPVVRLATGVLALGLVVLATTGRLAGVLDRSPTTRVLDAVLDGASGRWLPWSAAVGTLALLAVLSTLVGALPARWALARPMREELHHEGSRHPARPTPRSDLAVVVRLDRASVWRSVPLRRGLTVLAVMPGAVALLGSLEWSMMTVLPGLVASGAALLFGVNTWCLDGRGALWRHSLPVSPRVSFDARAIVLGEVLLGAAGVTLLLGGLRAGLPTPVEGVALVCCTLVVTLQVVGAAMRWSLARPYAVDLRSARATPAPPVTMAAYSARLALVTTVTGLVFTGLSHLPAATPVLLVTVLMVLWSSWRLGRTARQWDDPVVRARVVSVVAG